MTDPLAEATAPNPSTLPPGVAMSPALTVSDLVVEFATARGTVRAVNSVDFAVPAGRAVGILGESGSGKSVTASAIMGLLPTPPAHIRSGSVRLGEVELIGMPERTRRSVIGSTISMVFQDALSALNPVHPVGRQIAELYRVHRGMGRKAAKSAAVEMMRRVRIPDPEARARDFPHQFSGGMRQRIVIAMALALDPDVLIADEPTTALDVTVQAQILDLLREQQRARGMSLVLITHDINVVREVTDEVIVMYGGRIVESGPTAEVLASPSHPYTRGLARSMGAEVAKGERIPAIAGAPPDLLNLPAGCAFAPRCEFAAEACSQLPAREPVGPGRTSACWLSERVALL
ncbi:ABC transporter ATP-binding protein [Brevibacterium metallidurans]|uniref:ABC transporter ATP-binding protein n=1 Tax=Brevibacterium metallidurans TaxID=1482676 RepID=A0ABN0SIG2_9MICO